MDIATVYRSGSKKLDCEAKCWVWYDDFIKLMLRSLKYTNPNARVHLSLLEGKIETTNLNVEFYQGKFDPLYEWESIRKEEFRLWKLLLKKIDGPLLIVDNDVIFRDDISPAFLQMEVYDVGFYADSTKKNRSKFNKGVFFLNKIGGLEFVNRWEEVVLSNKKFADDRLDMWYIMQLSAYEVYRNSKDLKFWVLPKKYHDGDLTSDGIIWHGYKGSKYDKLIKFKKELVKI